MASKRQESNITAIKPDKSGPSNYAMVKAGWGNRPNFQLSYGLRMDPEGIEEGNALLDAFRRADAEDAEDTETKGQDGEELDKHVKQDILADSEREDQQNAWIEEETEGDEADAYDGYDQTDDSEADKYVDDEGSEDCLIEDHEVEWYCEVDDD